MALTPEQQAEKLRLEGEITRAMEERLPVTQQLIDAQARLNELRETGKVSAEEDLATLKEDLKIWENIARLTGEAHDATDQRVKIMEKELTIETDKLKAAAAQVEFLESQVDANGDLLEGVGAQIAAQKVLLGNAQGAIKALEKQKDILTEAVAASDSLADSTKSIAQGLLGSVDASQTLTGKLLAAAKGPEGIMGAIDGMADGLVEALNPISIMHSLFDKVLEATIAMVVSVDALTVSMNTATGTAGKYTAALDGAIESGHALGLSSAATGEATIVMAKEMTNFSNMSAEAQSNVAVFGAQMEKFGVSSSVTAANLEFATKALRMTTEEAMDSQKEIAATAQALGVPVEQMAADFQAAQPMLANYGKEGMKVFKGLAAQAKATGVAMDKLLGITGQFDTFEGAAEAAGKLNAVLGTQLNSVDLLMASDEERIAMLQESVASTGKAWEELDKYEKITIAGAAGITDMTEAAKLFGTTQGEMEAAAGSIEGIGAEHANLAEQTAAATTFGEKFALLLEKMAILVRPLIKAMHWLADVAFEVFDALGPLRYVIVAIVGAIILAVGAIVTFLTVMKMFKAMQEGIAMVQGVLNTIKSGGTIIQALQTQGTVADSVASKINNEVKEELVETEKDLADAQSKASNTGGGFLKFLKKLSKIMNKQLILGMLAFGAAVLMIGAGVGLAAYGVAQLVGAFAGLNPAQILGAVAAIMIFGITMVALVGILALLVMSGALPAAVGGMLAFGAAALMIGAGVALVAFGISMIIDSFANLFSILIEGASMMPQLALGLIMVGFALFAIIPGILALAAITPFMFIAAFGIAMLTLALAPFAIAALIAGIGMTLLADGMAFFMTNFSAFGDAIGEVLPQMVALSFVIVALSASMFLLAVTTPFMFIAAIGLMALSVALLPFSLVANVAGESIMMLAQGMQLLTSALIPFSTALFLAIPGMMLFSIGLIGLVMTMVALLPFMFFAAIGIGLLGAAMMPFAVASLMAGVGLSLLAEGMAFFIENFLIFRDALKELLPVMEQLAPVIFMVAMSFAILADATPMMFFAAMGMNFLTAAMEPLSVVAAIAAESLQSLVVEITAFVSQVEKFGIVVAKLASDMFILSASLFTLAGAITTLGVMSPFMMMISIGLGFLAAGLAPLVPIVAILAPAMESLSHSLITTNVALSALTVIVLQLAPALILLATGIYFVSSAVMDLAMMTPFIILVGLGLMFLSAVMAPFSIVALTAGIGMAQLAFGMKFMIEKIEPFAKTIERLTEILPMFVHTMFQLGALAFIIYPIVAVFGALAFSIMLLSFALSRIKTEDLRAIADLGAGLGNMSIEGAVAVETAMEATSDAVRAIANEPEGADTLTKVIELLTVPTPAGGGATKETTRTGPAGAPGAPGIGGRPDAGERTIILKLNDREFGRAVVNIFEKSQNLNVVS